MKTCLVIPQGHYGQQFIVKAENFDHAARIARRDLPDVFSDDVGIEIKDLTDVDTTLRSIDEISSAEFPGNTDSSEEE